MRIQQNPIKSNKQASNDPSDYQIKFILFLDASIFTWQWWSNRARTVRRVRCMHSHYRLRKIRGNWKENHTLDILSGIWGMLTFQSSFRTLFSYNSFWKPRPLRMKSSSLWTKCASKNGFSRQCFFEILICRNHASCSGFSLTIYSEKRAHNRTLFMNPFTFHHIQCVQWITRVIKKHNRSWFQVKRKHSANYLPHPWAWFSPSMFPQ